MGSAAIAAGPGRSPRPSSQTFSLHNEFQQEGCLNTFVHGTGKALIPSPLPTLSSVAGGRRENNQPADTTVYVTEKVGKPQPQRGLSSTMTKGSSPPTSATPSRVAASSSRHGRDAFQALSRGHLKGEKGFSLLELLIVVAIILIIAGISIPNLLRTRMAANDVAAVASLRAINTACFLYLSTYGGYPPTLASLGSPSAGSPASAAAADLLDSVLAAGNKSGYTFTYTAGTAVDGQISTYTVVADPVKRGATGQRGFFTDQTGVIRANPTGTADANSTPIG